MDPLPLYSKKTLADVQSMAPEIIAAAARYGVPAEAIAGSLAQEQFDQTASYWNEVKRTGSTYLAIRFLGEALERGAKINPSDPLQGASSYILHWYNSDPNAITVGSDAQKKLKNGLLIDYGPAGVKFQNAIHAILNNPDDPGFAPYRNNLFLQASRCRTEATKLFWHHPWLRICGMALASINPT